MNIKSLVRFTALVSCLHVMTACSSVHEALHGERTQPAAIRLTLLPTTPIITGKSSEIDAKITYIQNLSLVSPEDLQPKEGRDLTLFALDTTYSDLQVLTAKATSSNGLYHFSFTPRKAGSYRIWADAPLKSLPAAALPYSDIGKRTYGQFSDSENLTQNVNGTTLTLKSDASLKRFNEATLSLESSGGTTPITDAICIYNDYRTLLHLTPHEGKISFSPDKEGLMKCFVSANIGTSTATLPYTITIAKD